MILWLYLVVGVVVVAASEYFDPAPYGPEPIGVCVSVLAWPIVGTVTLVGRMAKAGERRRERLKKESQKNSDSA